jgi:hypothetical protein
MREIELMNDISDFLQYFKATFNDNSLKVQKHQEIYSCEAQNSKIFVSLSNPNDSEEFTTYIRVKLEILNFRLVKCITKPQKKLQKNLTWRVF